MLVICKYRIKLVSSFTGFQEKRNQFLASSFAIAVKESILSPWLCVVVAPLFLRAASMCVSIRRVHRYTSRGAGSAPSMVPLASLRCAERGFLQLYLLWFTP